jgi:hypothetical protein
MSSNKYAVLIAYTVRDRGKNQKSIWTRIGAAWPHDKGAGLNIQLEALPLDGRLVLLEPKPDDAHPAAAETGMAGGQ